MKTLHIPLVLDSRRRLGVATTSADVVRSQILDMMVTARGERAFRPDYGAGVPEMLFSNIDPNIFRAKEAEISRWLQAGLKLGTIAQVRIAQVDGTYSTLSVTVLFSLIPNGQVYTVSETFTGLATEESFV